MLKRTLVLTALLLTGCALFSQTEPAPLGDISGMYSFLRDGEFVQINISEDQQVGGFVSRYGDTPSDKGQFLDQFFESSSLQGNRLAFKTKFVHGVAYEFQGTVERGNVEDRNREGYLVLKGTLSEHRKDAEEKTTTKSQAVEFRSFPSELSAQ